MLFLAIDGGGTKTTCILADGASVLASVTAGASNIIRVGESEARANLHAAIQNVYAQAGISAAAVGFTVIGAAGSAVPQVAETLRRIIAELVCGNISVVGDMEIALEAAFAGQPGAIVIAGTGSIAFARNHGGQTARAGGWGYAISDEGSAHWIGRAGLRAALRAHDCAQDGTLLSGILGAWNLQSVQELVRAGNAAPTPDFAQLFPAVLQAARDGESAADRILHAAGEELAQLAGVVIGRLWPPKHPVRVALAGGVFLHSPEVRQAFYSGLRVQHPRAAVSFKIVEPVTGALWLARRCAAETGARLAK